MEILEILYGHPRFKLFFIFKPDIVEFFTSLTSILFGLDIIFRGVHILYKINTLSVSSMMIAWFFLILGLFQFIGWYLEEFLTRRTTSMTGILSWLLLTLLFILNQSYSSFGLTQWFYLINSLTCTWIYLRLGITNNGTS